VLYNKHFRLNHTNDSVAIVLKFKHCWGSASSVQGHPNVLGVGPDG